MHSAEKPDLVCVGFGSVHRLISPVAETKEMPRSHDLDMTPPDPPHFPMNLLCIELPSSAFLV